MKQKFKKVNEHLMVSLDGRLAVADFRASIPTQTVSDDAKRVLAEASLWHIDRSSVRDNVNVPEGRPELSDDRYVYADFRALSATLLRNRGLDFSRDGVLKKSVPMLLGRTVYPNHDHYDVNNWVGVVSQAKWDTKGEQTEGVPGINVEIKLDAYLNYRLACGVMMTPPAVNAMSLTVVFEFEYSHPQMAVENIWKFYENLGEEIDGEIVRLIVTKIVEYREASLVPVGEDRLAKILNGDDDTKKLSFSADAEMAADQLPPNSTDEEKKSMLTLTKEKKAELGIEFDGDEVPDELVFKAIDELSAKAKNVPENLEQLTADAEAGKKFVEKQRDEVTRLAKLAECEEGETELPNVIADDIKAASFDRLVDLEKFYDKKVTAKFGNGRSSAEDSKAVDDAGKTEAGATNANLPEASLL